jgi:hypothetical protein
MRPALAAILACALAGCAIRYDQAGVSRVGVFLWGLGDPPGVKWNLDAPRREIPDLPAAPRRDVLPPNHSAPERSTTAMNDNRDRVPSHTPEPNVVPLAGHADARDDDAPRR